MNIRSFLTVALAAGVLVGSSGCAIFSKGRKQMVTVRSVPSGASASINGEEVGRTPFKVRLPRTEIYRIDVTKEGFTSEVALIMPTPNEFEQKYFRWGVDYQLGAMTDLTPTDIVMELQPELSVGSSRVDLQACKLEYSIVSPK